MNLGLKNKMAFQGTVVSNAFIDTYMTAANGEYVKVFLYLLRHEGEEVTVSAIADALDHTEADVKRALAYWEEAGLLEREGDGGRPESRQSAEKEAAAARDVEIPEEGNSCDRMERLSGDEEFTALLYAVQQYLGKTFTQIECEKFAFFYDGLKMSGDLLEYLAEYCAGGGHSSIRYIEKVALNWYQMGIHTREEARDYTMRYSRDTSAVMKAFGITGRSPATAETEFMKRWFKEFGFDYKGHRNGQLSLCRQDPHWLEGSRGKDPGGRGGAGPEAAGVETTGPAGAGKRQRPGDGKKARRFQPV